MNVSTEPSQQIHGKEPEVFSFELLARDQWQTAVRRADHDRLRRELRRKRAAHNQATWSRRVRFKIGEALVSAGTAIARTGDERATPRPIDRPA